VRWCAHGWRVERVECEFDVHFADVAAVAHELDPVVVFSALEYCVEWQFAVADVVWVAFHGVAGDAEHFGWDGLAQLTVDFKVQLLVPEWALSTAAVRLGAERGIIEEELGKGVLLADGALVR